MEIKMILNNKPVRDEVPADMTLMEFVRKHGCQSVKCGCETSCCGLCTVFLDDLPVLSCSVLAVRAQDRRVTTLEGIREEARFLQPRDDHERSRLVQGESGPE